MMCTTFFHARKDHKREKPNSRKCDSPATTYNISNDNFPEITVHEVVKANHKYFTPEYIMDLKSAQRFSDMVASFFATKIGDATPFTPQEWKEVINDDDTNARNKERIYSSLYHGYPQEMRREIWIYLAEIKRLKQKFAGKGVTYESLKAQECPQAHVDRIRKDIIRSFSEHEYFSENKQEKLKCIQNILEAYANLDPDVGYTQGMNFMVGMLLCFLATENTAAEDENSEENEDSLSLQLKLEELEQETFWMLVYIMQEKDWRMSYVDHTPRLQDLLAKLEDMVSEKLPEVHKLLAEHNCLPACFAQYFLTIMIFYAPPALAKKVFEAFLIVGEEILLHVLVETLTLAKTTILQKQEMAELYCYLRNDLLKSI